jgi:hydrogenase maturation protease
MQIWGIGQRFRSDDGVGPYTCDLLQSRLGERSDIRIRLHQGDLLNLLYDWDCDQTVILIDALLAEVELGEQIFLPYGEFIPETERQTSTHGIGLAELFRLGEQLNLLPQNLIIAGVQISQLEMGSTMGREVEQGCQQLAKKIQHYIGEQDA